MWEVNEKDGQHFGERIRTWVQFQDWEGPSYLDNLVYLVFR